MMKCFDRLMFVVWMSVLSCMLWTTVTGLPEKVKCGNERCDTIISLGSAQIQYQPGEQGKISFERGTHIDVLGDGQDQWYIDVNGHKGFAPKLSIIENKVLVKKEDLVEVSTTMLSPQSLTQTQQIRPPLGTSENTSVDVDFTATTTAPLDDQTRLGSPIGHGRSQQSSEKFHPEVSLKSEVGSTKVVAPKASSTEKPDESVSKVNESDLGAVETQSDAKELSEANDSQLHILDNKTYSRREEMQSSGKNMVMNSETLHSNTVADTEAVSPDLKEKVDEENRIEDVKNESLKDSSEPLTVPEPASNSSMEEKGNTRIRTEANASNGNANEIPSRNPNGTKNELKGKREESLSEEGNRINTETSATVASKAIANGNELNVTATHGKHDSDDKAKNENNPKADDTGVENHKSTMKVTPNNESAPSGITESPPEENEPKSSSTQTEVTLKNENESGGITESSQDDVKSSSPQTKVAPKNESVPAGITESRQAKEPESSSPHTGVTPKKDESAPGGITESSQDEVKSSSPQTKVTPKNESALSGITESRQAEETKSSSPHTGVTPKDESAQGGITESSQDEVISSSPQTNVTTKNESALPGITESRQAEETKSSSPHTGVSPKDESAQGGITESSQAEKELTSSSHRTEITHQNEGAPGDITESSQTAKDFKSPSLQTKQHVMRKTPELPATASNAEELINDGSGNAKFYSESNATTLSAFSQGAENSKAFEVSTNSNDDRQSDSAPTSSALSKIEPTVHSNPAPSQQSKDDKKVTRTLQTMVHYEKPDDGSQNYTQSQLDYNGREDVGKSINSIREEDGSNILQSKNLNTTSTMPSPLHSPERREAKEENLESLDEVTQGTKSVPTETNNFTQKEVMHQTVKQETEHNEKEDGIQSYSRPQKIGHDVLRNSQTHAGQGGQKGSGELKPANLDKPYLMDQQSDSHSIPPNVTQSSTPQDIRNPESQLHEKPTLQNTDFVLVEEGRHLITTPSSRGFTEDTRSLHEEQLEIPESQVDQFRHSDETSTSLPELPTKATPFALPSTLPQETDGLKPQQQGLFATILGTVNSFLSNDKKEFNELEASDEELDRILYSERAQSHSDEDSKYCEKLSPNSCPSKNAHATSYPRLSRGQRCGPKLTMDNFAEDLAKQMLEKADMLACLVITAASSLLFLFCYYCCCSSNSESALLSRLNLLERSLFATHKENAILKQDLVETRSKLSSIEDNSFGSNEMVMSLKKELETEYLEKQRLQEQVANLEKELEIAAEAGLELNKIVSDLLSNQTGDESIINSVEQLQRQLNEQQNTILEINTNLAEKSRENSELQLMLAEQNARLSGEIASLQQDNDELEAEKSSLRSQLDEVKKEFEEDITKALEGKNREIRSLQTAVTELQLKREDLHTKWQTSLAKVEALEDCLKKVKRDPNISINDIIDAAGARAEIIDLQKQRAELKERLGTEKDSKKLLADEVKVLTAELEKLKHNFNQSEKDKLEAQTRLEVLSNYFKEKEMQLQKELSLKEAMWLKQQGEKTSTVDRLTSMQEEIQLLRSQNDSLRAEIEAQLAAHKAQIGTLENRAHESWLAARQSERRCDEARAEASALRRKLTTLVGGNSNDANADGKMVTKLNNAASPIPLESAESSLLGRMPPPPFLPPPFMGPVPPFMRMPPPFIAAAQMRPPPLGRLMSPPPPPDSGSTHSNHSRSRRYTPPYRGDSDNYDDDDDEVLIPHRGWYSSSSPYRSHSPSESRYSRDLMSTYDEETDFSPPPSPRDRRRRGSRAGNFSAYSPQLSASSPISDGGHKGRRSAGGKRGASSKTHFRDRDISSDSGSASGVSEGDGEADRMRTW